MEWRSHVLERVQRRAGSEGLRHLSKRRAARIVPQAVWTGVRLVRWHWCKGGRRRYDAGDSDILEKLQFGFSNSLGQERNAGLARTVRADAVARAI